MSSANNSGSASNSSASRPQKKQRLNTSVNISPRLTNNLAAKYKAAIFFDNDNKNILTVSSGFSCITAVKIPESEPFAAPYYKSYPQMLLTQEPLASYVERFQDNSYYQFLIKSRIRDDTYDELSGIKQVHIDLLNRWIGDTKNKGERVAVFDWDRTISLFEGAIGHANEAYTTQSEFEAVGINDPNPVESTLLYLCGGPERLAMLRGMFNTCRQNGVDIIIFTNNASVLNMPLFREAVYGITPGIKVICSANPTLDPSIKGNKGLVLKTDEQFSELCLSSGGRKKRKTLRKKLKSKQKRKTRTH
jgi:hypothetical protein